MKHLGLIVTALAGCASPREIEQPTIQSVPAALIASEGASFYVLETGVDWLDDDSKITSPLPGHEGILRTGEQGLALMLRYALTNKAVKFVGHADFQPFSGIPAEVTLFNPDAEVGGDAAAHRRAGFRVRVKGSPGAKPGYVDLEWEAEKLTDGPNSKDAKPGQYPRVVEKVAAGSGTMPLGMGIIMHHPRGGERAYVLILRIASLKDP